MIPARLKPLLRDDGVPMQLARLFAAADRELFLVGGSVRDALLGGDREPAEYDFATDARPDEVKEIVADFGDIYPLGEVFGTIGVAVAGMVAEITTFRSDVYREGSRKPQVRFADDVETDLARRDFTVNATALRLLPQPEIVDPYGGLADLGAGLLRTPLDPALAFGDDPLRMLRLFRFMSTLGFKADRKALDAVGSMSHRLSIVSAERIRDEFDKLMVGVHVETALRGLVESRLVDEFIPELAALADSHDPLHRHKDVLSHSIAVVGRCPRDRIVRLAALFHDVGKPDTRSFGSGGVSFHHHEVVGARMTRARMRALRYSKSDIEQVSKLVYLHMRPHTFKMGWTDRAVRRYVRDAGELLDRLNSLVRADVTTRSAKRERIIMRRIDELEERIADLREREEIDRLRAPIDGHGVMRYLGIEPGPLVGEAMKMLLEHRIDHGPYSEEEAYEMLRSWARQRGMPEPGAGEPEA
jgi:poly(A) polymerase